MSKANLFELHNLLGQALSKKIDHKSIETWSSQLWRLVKPKQKTKTPFTMMFPPPNVTGNLHLGHALTAALQDSLMRNKLMQGRKALWIPGFDHAGLATQNIVEKQLMKERKLSRKQLGHEAFVKLVDEWKDLKRNEMKQQLNRLGLVLDYEKEFFTMDKKSSLAVHTAFKRLFNSGLIYRADKAVFWSEELGTTLSDIEVETTGGVDRYIRTGEIVSKRPTPQWFIDTHDMAHKAVEAVNNESMEMIPPYYKKSWSSWLIDNGVVDWCISRQSWWGHKIPAFKLVSSPDVHESWVVADNLQEARELLGGDGDIVQDSDVLDTWFSSSLLPLTVTGWPNVKEFSDSIDKGIFPLDIMETGFDILSYWVSKMVMISLSLEKKIPFKTILLHGMICDGDGKKMSKSKGNIIDPLDVIDGISLDGLEERTIEANSKGILADEKLQSILVNQRKLFPRGIPQCGSDALRAFLLSNDFQKEVIRTQIAQLDQIRRLTNKIWNIYRFVFTMIESQTSRPMQLKIDLDVSDIDFSSLDQDDHGLLIEQARCVLLANKSFNETYHLHLCFKALEHFFVSELSSRYIPSLKLTSQSGVMKDMDRKLQLLVMCLTTSNKLMHPFMPYLTEFLNQKLKYSINPSSRTDDDKLEIVDLLVDETFPLTCDWSSILELCSSHLNPHTSNFANR